MTRDRKICAVLALAWNVVVDYQDTDYVLRGRMHEVSLTLSRA